MVNKLKQSILALEKLSGSHKITEKTKKEVEEHIKKSFWINIIFVLISKSKYI